MGSKRPARREFLRSGAALAGGATLGAAAPALGQTPASPPMIKEGKDQIAYGERSRSRHLGPHCLTAAGLRPITGGSRFMWRPRFRIR